jgi:cellulose synthase (UDP-forming)
MIAQAGHRRRPRAASIRGATRAGDLWAPGAPVGRWLLRVLIVLALFALGYYLSWWLHARAWTSPILSAMLAAAFAYTGTQLIGAWVLYFAARRRPAQPTLMRPPTIDVFVTACREPPDLVERSLAAACAMRGEHRIWLLDDGDDPRLADLTARLGAGYLTRPTRQDAKAGNVNAALARTDGEIVVIFDVDHVPTPDFLERTLGYFADPRIGFVQVMLTFSNENQSWVARAATETALDYYNPTSIGADGLGAAALVGSNALIRRAALDSIGGYHPGLAEDLATSVALHAAGWRSAYVAEPLAPGLAPPDVPAWFAQQLKWARGVFELLLTAYPRSFGHLTWGQRWGYAVRMTYYWVGLVSAVHLVATLAILVADSQETQVAWADYLLHITPLCVLTLLVRQAAIRTWRHPSTPTAPCWRAMMLVYATWPVYTLAWTMAILRVPLGFRPTPKSATSTVKPSWLVPQALALALLVGALLRAPVVGDEPMLPLVIVFAAGQCLGLATLLLQALRPGIAAAPTPDTADSRAAGTIALSGPNPV